MHCVLKHIQDRCITKQTDEQPSRAFHNNLEKCTLGCFDHPQCIYLYNACGVREMFLIDSNHYPIVLLWVFRDCSGRKGYNLGGYSPNTTKTNLNPPHRSALRTVCVYFSQCSDPNTPAHRSSHTRLPTQQ